MRFLFLFTLVFGCFIPLAASVRLDLYVMAGQSNMSGRVRSGFSSTPIVDNDILYYYRSDGPPTDNQTSDGAFVSLRPLSSGYYGPEVAFARLMHAHAVNKIAVIKISDGSTSLARDWNSRASTENEWWQHWLSDTSDARGKLKDIGYQPTLKGICWLQGESDASDLVRATNYEENFRHLVQDMFLHLGSLVDIQDARFVTAGLGPLPTRARYGEIVRTTQRRVTNTNPSTRYFETSDLSLLDDIHFDAESNSKIGERFAEQFLPPPTIDLLRLGEGTSLVFFSGILYSSADLNEWARVEPQPFSIFFVNSKDGKMFYRTRLN